jgi:hypothetical protein
MVFPYNKKTQSIILKTLEQYWLLNSMYESIDAYTFPSSLNCEMLGNIIR